MRDERHRAVQTCLQGHGGEVQGDQGRGFDGGTGTVVIDLKDPVLDRVILNGHPCALPIEIPVVFDAQAEGLQAVRI